jgi:hypothetical protein
MNSHLNVPPVGNINQRTCRVHPCAVSVKELTALPWQQTGDATEFGGMGVVDAARYVAIRRWNDFGRVNAAKPRRERVQPRPESLTPVHAKAGSR